MGVDFMDFTKIRNEIWGITKEIFIAFLLFVAIQVVLYVILGVYPAYRVVVSGSMEPVFYRGDVVFIKHMNPDNLLEGDILVFKNPYDDTPIVHRIIKITQQGDTRYFATKGDNNFSPDSYYPPPGIPEDGIVGKVIFKVPKVGLVALWFKDVWWRIRYPMGGF
jgi:signal peptidase